MRASLLTLAGLRAMLAQLTGAYVYLRNLAQDVLDEFVHQDEVSTTPGVDLIPRAGSEVGEIDVDWIPRIDESTGGGVPDANRALVTASDGYVSGWLLKEAAYTPGLGDTIPVADGDAGGRIDSDFIPILGLDTHIANQSVGQFIGVPLGGGPLEPVKSLSAAESEAILGISTTSAANGIPKANSGGVIDPEWIGGDSLPFGKIQGNGTPALGVTDSGTAAVWLRPANFPCVPMFKTSTASVSAPRISGTSFPSTDLIDGMRAQRTDMGGMWFYYDTARGGWLSDWSMTILFNWSADVPIVAYLGIFPTVTAFSNTFGPTFGFPVKVVELMANMAASGTGALEVFDDGAALSGAELSLSSQQTKIDSAVNSSVVAAFSILGVKSKSGTLEGPGLGSFTVRRFEA